MNSVICLLLFFAVLFSPVSHGRSPIKKGIDNYADYVSAVVAGSLDSAGLSFRAFMDPNLPSWRRIKKDINFDLSIESCLTLECDGGRYENDLAFTSGSMLAGADRVGLLPNRESFELRERLFSEARESILIMTWAVYDDETGFEFQNQLLQAIERNPELDVRIIVDGNVASLKGHREVLKNLEELSGGKIKVMRWKTYKYRANGTHRKLIVVDKRQVITGGMNIGNAYANLEGAPQWRDLDMFLEGDSVGLASYNQFVMVWNSHDSRKISEQHLRMLPGELLEEETGVLPVVVLDQHPGSTFKRAQIGLHTAVVKLLRNAQRSIDIENAYFILDPVLKEELKKTIKRGVKVRIFTNSKESIDMPLVSIPVLKSARAAARWGAEVYLKKGPTLHGKYLVVDRKLSMVGSFNFHPRSLRFDGENAVVVMDEAFAGELTDYFEEGIHTQSELIHTPALFKIGRSLWASLIQFFYFDFL